MIRLRIILLSNYLYLIILLFTIIYTIVFLTTYKHESEYTANDDNINGIVTNYKIDGNILSLDIKAKENIKVSYVIASEEEKEYYLQNMKYGIKLNIIGELEKPINNTIPNTFNYKKYLTNKKNYWILRAENLTIINYNENLLYKIKNLIQKQISKSKKSKAHLETFIIGNMANIDYETNLIYQKNGIGHLFALSGMHVSLFTGLIIKLLKKLKINEGKRYVIATFFIFIYIAITGFVPSLLRSGLFFALLSLNKIYYTHIKTLNILILTGCLITVFNPFVVYDLGFQYSFATSLGLIIASKKLNNQNYFLKLLTTSIIAFLFSIPISLNNFYEINLFSIINNLIFIPLITIIIYPLSLVIFLFPFLDYVLYFFIMFNDIINKINASITFLIVIVPKMSILLSFLYYFFLILFCLKSKYFIFLLFVIIFYLRIKPYFDSSHYVYYIDIGQGDCTLIRHAYNKEVLLIDTGGRMEYETEEWAKRNKKYNISDNYITFFKSIGINHIDNLILTHGDEDHLGETLKILTKIKVENIIINKGNINLNEQNIINSFINVKVENIDSKYSIMELNKWNFDDENEDSQVLLMKIDKYNFLFMGDAGHPVEEKIIKEYELNNIEFLKLGHHGSKNSSKKEYLEYINPKYALISAGRNNRYNHPSFAVIENLASLNIPYFNTQINGTIMVKISQDAYTISTYSP